MHAIKTRYFGPTNYKGSRIKASAAAGTLTVSFDYALDDAGNHTAAAAALAVKLGWPNTLAHGVMPSGDYCHVLLDGDLS